MSDREIVYDHEMHSFAMYLDKELVGFANSYHEAEITFDQLVFELIDQTDTDAPLVVEIDDDRRQFLAKLYSASAGNTCQSCGDTSLTPFCPACDEAGEPWPVSSDPPAGPDSDPVPPWPNLFEQYRAAYGWACVELDERRVREKAA